MSPVDTEYGSAMARLVQSLIGEVRENSVALATFSSELRTVRDNVTSLTRIVKDGDNSEPLITKVALIEKSLEEIEGVALRELSEQFRSLNDKVSKAVDSKELIVEDKKDKRETRAQKLQFWGAIIAGVLSLAGIAISILLKS